jgi:RNA polymerase sigma-70 factor (ECF subfamily)
MREVRGGNPQHFDLLMSKYDKLLWKIAVNSGVKNPSDVEEIVADTFISLWRNASSYDTEKGGLKNYLARIAKNRAVDFLRTKHSDTLPLDDFIPDNVLSAEAAVLNSEIQSEIAQAFNILSPEEKDIVQRRLIGGQKSAEIASETGKSLRAIENKLYYAKLKLKKFLKMEENNNE